MRSILLASALCVLPITAAAGAADPTDGVSWQDEDLSFDDDLKRDRKNAKKLDDDEFSDDLGFEFEDPEEEFDLLEDGLGEEGEVMEDFEDFGDPSEDFDMMVDEPRRKKAPTAPAGPGAITLDVAGKTPLGDNYPLSVIAVDRDAVVVELPVLVARSRVGHEADFSLTARVQVGDEVVTQVSQLVTKGSLAEFGPSFSFFKMLAPVVEPRGEVTVVVLKGEEELFTRTVPYAL